MKRSILWAAVLSISCAGAHFEGTSELSVAVDGGSSAEASAGSPVDASASSSVDAGAELVELERDAGAGDATSEPRPVCNTPEEFQHECVLWLRHELDDAGTCWGRCGTCDAPPIGAQLVCVKR